MYLSLSIDPSFVDVNIHPTKREVRIVNEEAICKEIGEIICEKLGESRGTKTLALNSVASWASSESVPTSSSTPYKRKYVDHSVRTLDFYSYPARAKIPCSSPTPSAPQPLQKPTATRDSMLKTIYCREELKRFRLSCVEQSDQGKSLCPYLGLVNIMKFFVFIGHLDCGDVLFQHDLTLYRLSLFSIR